MNLPWRKSNTKIALEFYTPAFTFKNYGTLLTDEIYLGAIWTTILLSLTTSPIVLLSDYARLCWRLPFSPA